MILIIRMSKKNGFLFYKRLNFIWYPSKDNEVNLKIRWQDNRLGFVNEKFLWIKNKNFWFK
jgi:hypothetical protein